MTKKEKRVLICALRFSVVFAEQDSPIVLDAVKKNIQYFNTEELNGILGECRFSLHLIPMESERPYKGIIRDFANDFLNKIRQRKMEELSFSKERSTSEPTFFKKDDDLSRFIFALALAYGAPLRTYIFDALRKGVQPFLQEFSKEELLILIHICEESLPKTQFGSDSVEQAEVKQFIYELNARIQQGGFTERGDTMLTESFIGSHYLGN